MPSPKNNTRRHRSKSPSRGTRRAAAGAAGAAGRNLSFNDPLLTAMARGELKWGDLLYKPESPVSDRYKRKSRSPASRSPPAPRAPQGSPASPAYSPINDVFEGYKTPDLRLRKFIWENFPIVLEPIATRDGSEKYAVKWHRAHLEEWRSSRTESYEEAMEYELFSELRLIHALRKHAHLYALHEPRSRDEIVVIEMKGAARAPPAPTPASAAYAGPVLRKLNDITVHFPGVVVWGKVDGRAGESTYALKIRGDFHRKTDRKVAERTLAGLESALRASRFWAVLAPKDGEFLRIEMSHD
jgi:hypothetical protein